MSPIDDKLNETTSIKIEYADILKSNSIEDTIYVKIKSSEDLIRRNVYKNAVSRISYEVKEGRLKLEKGETIEGLAMDEALAFQPSFDVNFVVSRNSFFEDVDNVKQVYEKLAEGCGTHVLNVAILEDFENQPMSAPIGYSYTSSEFDKILEFYKYTQENSKGDGDILFIDSKTNSELCLGEVYYLNKKIDTVVEFIRANKFTPFEAMIYIHNYVTSFKYTRGDASQIIVGALNGQEIVCSGYASIIKAIIDKLNMPGLKCDIVAFNKINQDKTNYDKEGHALCLIDLEDKKYRINGTYNDDAAGDFNMYGNKIKDNGRFAFFLYPTSDLNLTLSNGERLLYAECESSNRGEQVIAAPQNCDFKKDIKKIEKQEKIITSKNNITRNILKLKTKPISRQTLIKGLYNVIEKDPTIRDEYDCRSTKGTIRKIILNSLLVNLRSYMPQALNCLTKVWRDSGYFEAEDKEEVKRVIKKSISDEIDAIATKIKGTNNEQTRLR